MDTIADLGWELVWFDQLARALLGIGLLLGAALGGWATWVAVLAAAAGGVLIFEALIRYCPLARIWPWNR